MNKDPSDITQPSVSVVVPCYNGAEYVEKTLSRVFDQTAPPLEVLFYDDGSTDGSAAVAARHPVRILSNGGNRGLAFTRNRAIQEAEGDTILFLDVDAWPDVSLVATLQSEFQNPSTAAVAGRGVEANVQNAYDRFRARFFSQGLGLRRIERAGVLFGLCSAYRREVLREMGGFDPEFRTNGEDFDLSFRLRSRGFRIVYNPSLVVHHHRHDDGPSFYRMVYRWFYWGGRAYQKNGRRFLVPFVLKSAADLPVQLAWAASRGGPLSEARIPLHVFGLRLRATRDLARGRPPAL